MLPFLFLSSISKGQSMEVKDVVLDGGNIVLHYSLHDTVPGRTFMVNLYTSHDNFITPASALQGDHGIGIKAGNDKRLTWNARQELGAAYSGKVAVEIRARVYVPFILFDDFESIKRGKPKDITWRGGARQSTLNFELYNRNDEKVITIPNINAQAGHTSLYIPTDVKSGRGYRLKIIDSRNRDQVVYTDRFVIRRKVPLALMAVPVVAAGGAIMLTGGGGSSPGDIGDPPLPPDN